MNLSGIYENLNKTGEDRRIQLCPRALAVLERQLRLRNRFVRQGRISHQHLFFTDEGTPIPDVKYPYTRWERTLKRLAIRYRKPYVARHTSVSWNLMIGRNPLLVAKEHGHRILTMLTVYAAWTKGAVEADILAIREAMNGTGPNHPRPPRPKRMLTHALRPEGTSAHPVIGDTAMPFDVNSIDDRAESDFWDGDAFGSGFASSGPSLLGNYLTALGKIGGADGTRRPCKLMKKRQFLPDSSPCAPKTPPKARGSWQPSAELRRRPGT